MQLTTTCEQESFDCIVLAIGPDGQWSAAAADLDTQCGGALARGVESGDVSKKQGDATLLPLPAAAAYASVLLVGTGEADAKDIDAPLAYRLGATALRSLSSRQRENVCVNLGDALATDVAEALVAGAVAGTAGQSLYHSEPQLFPPSLIAFAGVSESALAAGQTIGEAINATRHLVNEPGNVIYPETFAGAASEVAQQCGLKIEVWDEQRLEQENCHAMLAVGKGSVRPPRLVKLTYCGNPQQTTPPIALVGKGVTFDSGGLSLKPSAGMLDMKMDMAGAATVLGVIRCLSQLKAKCNVVGYMGLAENMIDGNSYRLGDVVKTRSGKTVEIHNTDAEGRVVLADVLDVAVKDGPAAVVDLATLTGACLVALGTDTVGLMGNDEDLQTQIQQAAEQQGEWVWPLPMHSFFDEQVKSKVADLKNVGVGRWGGAITAAKFLEAFVGDAKWLHMDIAGPAFAEAPTPERDAGATGTMVRTLVHWLRKQA